MHRVLFSCKVVVGPVACFSVFVGRDERIFEETPLGDPMTRTESWSGQTRGDLDPQDLPDFRRSRNLLTVMQMRWLPVIYLKQDNKRSASFPAYPSGGVVVACSILRSN